jgi:ferredoxin-NADP reductase
MVQLAPERRSAPRRLSPLSLFESLATPHGVDRYLELVNPMLTVHELRAAVTNVERQTADTVTLTLKPTRRWNGFKAGQFVQVHVLIDGVRHTRCYSPASSQHRTDGRIELTVKAHPDGVVSQYLVAHARPGLVVGLSHADGAFVLPDARPRRTLLISGGSGITPVLSMLRTLVDEAHDGEVVFLHYAYTAQDVPYADELRAIADRHPNVRVVLGYTEQATGGDLHGYFGREHLDDVAPWFADADTFLCGPGGLMKAVREHYRANGAEKRLHTEEFAPPALSVVAGEASGEVSFARSGSATANTGAPLLEQAEAAGLTPEYGCRMGICFSCTAVKKSGCTRDLRTGITDADPDREIQLCVSVPVGDVTLDI